VGKYHGSNDDAISCEVTKSLKPTRTILLECIPFKEGSVKHVHVVDKFLEIFQGDL